MAKTDLRRMFVTTEMFAVERNYEIRIIAMDDAHPLTKAIVDLIFEEAGVRFCDEGSRKVSAEGGRLSRKCQIGGRKRRRSVLDRTGRS